MWHFEHIAMYYWHMHMKARTQAARNVYGYDYSHYKDMSAEPNELEAWWAN